MGTQVKFIVGAGLPAQCERQHQPPQRQPAERTLALADTGLRKGRIERGVVHRTGRRKALPHPVALALNVMVEDVRGRVLVKKFGIFGVKQPCAVKFGGDVGADGPQQLFQAGGGIGRGAQAQPRKAAAVREQVAAQPLDPGPKAEAAQAAAVVKRRAVQGAHRVGQGDLLHKIAGDLMGVGPAVPRPGLDRLVGKAVRPDLGDRQTLHGFRHGRAGAVPQHPQHPGPRSARLPYDRHEITPLQGIIA